MDNNGFDDALRLLFSGNKMILPSFEMILPSLEIIHVMSLLDCDYLNIPEIQVMSKNAKKWHCNNKSLRILENMLKNWPMT